MRHRKTLNIKKKQRKFCSKLYKKCHERLDLKSVINNKVLRKTIKLFFSDKATTFPKILFVQK